MSRRHDLYDLDLDADEFGFLQDTPVYCPVPWCTAHAYRFGRCGDKDGDYTGIHVARIEYAAREPARVERELRVLQASGVIDPVQAYWIMRTLQDAVDTGLIPGGRKGRRYLVPGSRFNSDD